MRIVPKKKAMNELGRKILIEDDLNLSHDHASTLILPADHSRHRHPFSALIVVARATGGDQGVFA